MSDTDTDVATLTRPEYDSAVHFGTAGQATALTDTTIADWRQTHPGWKGKYWAYGAPDAHHARHLHPINVAPKTKK